MVRLLIGGGGGLAVALTCRTTFDIRDARDSCGQVGDGIHTLVRTVMKAIETTNTTHYGIVDCIVVHAMPQNVNVWRSMCAKLDVRDRRLVHMNA